MSGSELSGFLIGLLTRAQPEVFPSAVPRGSLVQHGAHAVASLGPTAPQVADAQLAPCRAPCRCRAPARQRPLALRRAA
eukprot:5140310-Alexandrium_andersonii.AAC.1